MRRTAAIATLLTLAVAGSLLGGCGPTSVTFTFGGDPSRLEQTAVLDADAPASSQIALIDLRGLIVDGPRSAIPFVQSGDNPVDELVARLEKARRDSTVKAVVLRVNSPGGAVTASDTMFQELRRFRERSNKPLVVSMGEVAASGGYYVALAADRIVAQPTTITGSVGVIVPTLNVSAGLNRLGIMSRSIKSGVNKDLANPLEPMRDGQYAVLQAMVDEMYDRFRALVVERRLGAGFDPTRADELLDGRVFTGAAARSLGLVDELGDVRDAFEVAKVLAGVREARLIKYHAEGARPKSAYAISDVAAGDATGLGTRASAGGTTINLLQLHLGADTGTLTPAAAYYLWSAGPLVRENP
jgi:protease IV